ncbi:MAG: trigger factor [Nitrospinota bacterium]
MRVDVEEIDACTKRLSIAVPSEDVSRAFDRAYQRLRQKVRLPGFRKGKVPRSLLERHYRDAVERDVLETLIPESYAAALEESSLNAVGQPKVDAVEMKEEEPLRFTATVEVIPAFEIPAFEGREFEKPIPRVLDEDVEHMLDHLREQHAQLENVEGRPVQEGDHVILDISGTVDGVERDDLKSRGQVFVVGRKTLLPELEEALPGAAVDETRRVEAVFPPDHRNPDLAGKTAHFAVAVLEIKVPVHPELNDDFARSLGEFQSLDDLRAAVREDLGKNAEQQGLAALKRSILDALVEEALLEMPKGLVEGEREGLIQHVQGMIAPKEREKLDRDRLAADLEPQARKNVKERILLDRIGDRDDIQVAPAEVEAEVRRMAARYGKPYPEFRSYLEGRDGLAGIAQELRQRKVLDSLAEKVRVVVKEEERSVLAEHGHDAEEEELSPLPAGSPAEE